MQHLRRYLHSEQGSRSILQIIGFAKESEAYLFDFTFAAVVLVLLLPSIRLMPKIGLKYLLLLSFALIGIGVTCENLDRLSEVLPFCGILVIGVGGIGPSISLSYLAHDWFLQAEQILVLGAWEVGKIVGQSGAFLSCYYYFHIEESSLDKEEILERFSNLMRVYLAMVLTSILLIIVFVKSKPEGLERTRKHRDSSIFAQTIREGGSRGRIQRLMLNEEALDQNRAMVEFESMSALQKILVLMSDGNFWLFGFGAILPISVTNFGEIVILKNLKVFHVDPVE